MSSRTPLHVCTAATSAQLPSVRVLAASLRQHEPNARLSVLVLDGTYPAEEATQDTSPRVLLPDALGLPGDLFAQLAMACNAAELTATLVPWLVRRLVEEGAPAAIALSPETEVFHALDDVVETAVEHGLVLVPRVDASIPDDGLEPDASQLRAAGPFTSAFVAVSAGGTSFLEWWCRRQQQVALSRGGFASAGPWTADVPAAFPSFVLRGPGHGASAWNLDARELRATNGGYEVSGAPLRWFDFGGYTPERPHLLTTDFTRARVRLGDQPSLARLCDEHCARLRAAGYADRKRAYGYGTLRDGRKIDARMRRIYVDALCDAAEHGAAEPPSPFGSDGADTFASWITEPVAPSADPLVSRYLARVRDEDPVLRDAFPSIAGEGAEAYLGEVRGEPRALEIPDWVLPTEDDLNALMWHRWRSRPTGPRPWGVNVVGYVTAVLGVGHVARVFASLLDAGAVPTAVVANQETMSQKSVPFETQRAGEAPYDVNLLCVNADHTALLAEQLGPEFLGGRRTIGVWAWEVEDFPVSSISAFDLVDEVWVGSDFEYEAIAPVASKPVRKHPPPVLVPSTPPTASRAELGLPEDRFLFLFVYDFLSTAERKNPVGLIEAYTSAFGPEDGAVLVLKSINGDKRVEQLERVRRAADGRPDVIVLDAYLSPDLHNALLAHCDAYVSLHRSEGFGLDLAAAMGLGKPVIATGYSGNLEFMDDATAYLVEYDLEPVGPGNDPYPANSRWAKPRTENAAALMRRVVERPDEARERGRRAAASVRTRFSVEARSRDLARMIDEVRARPAPQGSWRRFFAERWRAERHQDEHLPYGRFWLPDGNPLDQTMRRLLVTTAGHDSRPDPEVDLTGFYRWLNARVFPPKLPVVSRYLYELWRDRTDLQGHFPRLDREPRAYLKWLVEHGHDDTDIPYQLLPTVDDLRRLTEYQERLERRARVARAVRAAGQRAAALVTRR
jgi:glycosyltransferase involved in cell wall biosynthesis